MQKIGREIRRVVRDLTVNGMMAHAVIPDRVRWRLLRWAGYNLQPCRIMPNVFVGSGSLTIGEGTAVNREVFLDPTGGIEIGRDTRIGMRTLLITASHAIGPTQDRRTDRSSGTEQNAPIRIHDHVWVGAGVTILPGVEIGPGCVIAAGAVVTRSCEPNGLYGGVPASRLRDLPV